MVCKDLRSRLSAYLDRELKDEDSKLLELHLASCIDCRKYLGELKGVDRLLTGLPEIEPAPGLTVRLISDLDKTRTGTGIKKAWEVVLNWVESVFRMYPGIRYQRSGTLEEFGDFPPLSISCAYFSLLGHGR
ncbi:MAG: anti-sigma factor [Syntrophobacteraceae bacterium]